MMIGPEIAIADATTAGISAGAGSWTAPSRDLHGAAVSATAHGLGGLLERATCAPALDKDQKLSHGLEQSSNQSPVSGAGFVAEGACFASLDSITNNRHKPPELTLGEASREPDYYRRPVGRGKYCGRMSIIGADPDTGAKKYRRINCGSWVCSYCGPRKARTARARIRAVADELGLRYFLTLTLDPKKLDAESQRYIVPYLRLCFNKFREYLKRKFGVCPAYICILEFTKAGVPHLHVLMDRYVEQQWISKVWSRLGGGQIVFIRQVTVIKVARYLSKYLTKNLLLSAPKGTRRLTTSRSIVLFPRFDSGVAWELQKQSIWRALEAERLERRIVGGIETLTLSARSLARSPNLFEFIMVYFDEEHFLVAFDLPPEHAPANRHTQCKEREKVHA
jgi:hypothetical protein